MRRRTIRSVVQGKSRTLRPVAERFGEKVDRSGECWLWTGARARNGYGKFGIGHVTWSAHRVAWILEHGTNPGALHVCHTCDNPPCVRPSHLFLADRSGNMMDMISKGRGIKPEQHARGSRSGAHTHPERVARGDRHSSRTHPERLQRGEQSHFAKLTAEQVLTIRRRYAAGERQIDIAKSFGIRQTAVSAIVLRQTWKHIVQV